MPGESLKSSDEIADYFEDFPQIVTRVGKVVGAIHFAFRTDGIFIFSLLPKTPPKSKIDYDRLEMAAELVSHMIKMSMQHTHVYHGVSSSGKGRSSTMFLSRRPVRLYDYSIAKNFEKLIELISNEESFKDKLDTLKSDVQYVKSASSNYHTRIGYMLERDTLLSILPSYSDSKRGVDRPALLKLRVSFSKNFDDLFQTIEVLRNRVDVYFYPTVIYSALLIAFVISWIHFNYDLAADSDLLLKGLGANFLGVLVAYTSGYIGYLGLKRTKKYRHWIVEDSFFPNLLRRILSSRYAPIAVVSIYALCLFEFFIPFYEFAPDILKNLIGADQETYYVLPWPTLGDMRIYVASPSVFTGYFLFVIGYITTFYIEWFVKRRRSSVALANTAGALKYGTIYSNVIERIYLNKSNSGLPNMYDRTAGGFHDAISIIEDRIAIETRKKWVRAFPFFAGFVFLVMAGKFVSPHITNVIKIVGTFIF